MSTHKPTESGNQEPFAKAKSLTAPIARCNPILELELVLARRDLATFVRRQAVEAEQRLGFGIRPTPTAPNTYQQLRGAYVTSVDSGVPLPISNLYCEDSIYFAPSDNVAFRFWHDTAHVALGVSFSLEDELELAQWHLEQLERAGLTSDTLPWKVFHADTVGQIQLMGLIGRFPINQLRFVTDCIEFGPEVGLLDEIRRLPSPDAPTQVRSDILVTT